MMHWTAIGDETIDRCRRSLMADIHNLRAGARGYTEMRLAMAAA